MVRWDMDSKPYLQNYLSITKFMQDEFLYRKNIDPLFSYEAWANELGFKSRSFMRMVCTGSRPITKKFISTFCQKMNYSAEEIKYFNLLVSYSQTSSQHQKIIYGEQLLLQQKTTENRLEILNHYEFLSSVLLPKLQVLLSFSDLEKSPEKLAKLLDAAAPGVEQALLKLEKMGLATAEPDQKTFKATQKSFKVVKSFGNPALENYHNNSLLEAIKAQKLEAQIRRFRSLILPLNEDEFSDLLEEVEIFVKKTLSKYNADELLVRRLFQMNINVFPVTQKVEK